MNKAVGTSRHTQLAAELASEISAGTYPLGAKFPTEKELQERYQIGRHTIREALKVLSEQGLIGRRRKTGTVIMSHKPVSRYVHSLRDIHSLLNFAQNTILDVRHEGYARPMQGASDFLDAADQRWFRIAGIRSTRQDPSPLCWSEVLVPEAFTPDRDEVRKRERAIYEIILDQYGLKLEYVEQKVSATQLPTKMAGLLNAEGGSAGLIVERRYVAHTGATFEVSQNTYPADRYSIYSVIRQRT